MMYDILILTAEKDFLKFRFVYDSIIKNFEGVNKIYCISNTKMPKDLLISDVKYLSDRDVIDFDFSKFKGNVKIREGWYKQQFIKLFQQVTSDNYLVVDSDVYFCKKIDIIENGKPSFLFGRDQHHKPYFRYTKRMLNLDRVYPYSFINEIMFFKRDVINHMVSSVGSDVYGFFELSVIILNKLNEKAAFAEYEIYGNYVTKHFPDSYNYKYLKTHFGAKRRLWNTDEIKEYIDSIKGYDMISMHTWI